MSTPKTAIEILDEANIELGKELFRAKSNLDVSEIIGLNANSINGKPGKSFLGFAQMMSQRALALSLENIFEWTNDGAGLCSVRGVYALTKGLTIRNINVATEFAMKHGVVPSDDWESDVNNILLKERPLVRECLELTSKYRNQRIAHLERLDDSENIQYALPGFDHCEKVLTLAYDFYAFIHCAFVGGTPVPIMKDTKIRTSLIMMLKRLGIDAPRVEYSE